MSNDNAFTYRVVWSDEDRAFVGLSSEFPSLSWVANTREGALTGIEKLVAGVVADMRAHDEELPSRSPR